MEHYGWRSKPPYFCPPRDWPPPERPPPAVRAPARPDLVLVLYKLGRLLPGLVLFLHKPGQRPLPLESGCNLGLPINAFLTKPVSLPGRLAGRQLPVGLAARPERPPY